MENIYIYSIYIYIVNIYSIYIVYIYSIYIVYIYSIYIYMENYGNMSPVVYGYSLGIGELLLLDQFWCDFQLFSNHGLIMGYIILVDYGIS